MPIMPRLKSVSTKIAFSILGTPANLKEKKTPIQRKIDRQLLHQNTQRVR